MRSAKHETWFFDGQSLCYSKNDLYLYRYTVDQVLKHNLDEWKKHLEKKMWHPNSSMIQFENLYFEVRRKLNAENKNQKS